MLLCCYSILLLLATHICLAQMPVERCRVELCQAVDLGDVAVDTVADWDVNKAVVCTQGHSRLSTLLRKRVQTAASTTTKNNT